MEVPNSAVSSEEPVLLSAWGARRRACRSFLADATVDVDATLAVVVGHGDERFLDAWRDLAETAGNLAVLDVGREVRSGAAATDTARHSVVRGLPLADVSALREEITAYLEDWHATGDRAAVYVEGAGELVPEVGLPGLVELLDQIVGIVREADGETYVGVAGERSDVVAVLSPAFDAVVDLEWTPDGTYRATRRDAPDSSRLSLDRAFDLLRSPRRRRVLEYLDRVGTTQMDDLVRFLVRTDGGFGADGPREAKRLRVALHQFDLPKLADAGVVTYDAESGTVEGGERLGTLRPFLALAATHQARGNRST